MRSIPRKAISFSDVDRVLSSLELQERRVPSFETESAPVTLPTGLMHELNIYASQKGMTINACLEGIVRNALKPQMVSKQDSGMSEILHGLRSDLESLLSDLGAADEV